MTGNFIHASGSEEDRVGRISGVDWVTTGSLGGRDVLVDRELFTVDVDNIGNVALLFFGRITGDVFEGVKIACSGR